MVQSVECPSLDLTSGHDLRVVRSSPASGSVLSIESAGYSLPLVFPLFSLSLSVLISQSINHTHKKPQTILFSFIVLYRY